jgi:hypothetical protein
MHPVPVECCRQRLYATRSRGISQDFREMGIRFTHPAPGYCGFHLSLAPAIVVW